MILEQFYLQCLAHASYVIGDEASGMAAVVDPQRDVEQYLAFAAEHGLRIGHVILTHLHADFVAGHVELRDRAGATIYLGAAAKADYAFTPLRDGDAIESRARAAAGARDAGTHRRIDLAARLRRRSQCHRAAGGADRRHAVRRRRRASRSARGARLVGQRARRPALRFAARQAAGACPTARASTRRTAPDRCAARRSARKRRRRSASSGARTTRCSR